MPDNTRLNTSFTQKQYNVLLVGSKDTTENHVALLREMVSQRLAQDFQLVTSTISKDKGRFADHESTSFCLSMGHRVHFLVILFYLILLYVYSLTNGSFTFFK
jgi:hypothetical protein